MAPSETIRVKNNTNEWFDGEIVEKIAARDKLFRKFEKSKLSVDEIYTKKQEIPCKLQLETRKGNFYKKSYLKT